MSDERLNRIEDKIDKLGEKVSSIDKTLAEQHISLKEHIKRTNILEAELKPLKAQSTMFQGVLKTLGILALLASVLKSVYEFVKGR